MMQVSIRCLKVAEKVSFNIASVANYNYILIGQKLIKNAKNGQFWLFFNELLFTQNVNLACYARNVEWDFFCDFQTLC